MTSLDLRDSRWSASRWAAVRWHDTSATTDRSAEQGRIHFFPSTIPVKDGREPRRRQRQHFEGIEKAVRRTVTLFSRSSSRIFSTRMFPGQARERTGRAIELERAAGASAIASLACVATWPTDFRKDLSRIEVPSLVIHGEADRILPIGASGLRTAKLVKGARLLTVKEGPHCITWTHADVVTPPLLEFLK